MWDVSAFVGPWPFRHLPDAVSVEALEKRLRQWGVTRAFVSPLEALFQADPMPVNSFWAARLAESDFFRFAPVLNPSLPIPPERALAAIATMPGKITAVRLHPNYHGYTLDGDAARAVTRKAGEQGLVVIAQMRMQDVRGMHPLLRVADTEAGSVLDLACSCPETAVIAAGLGWGAANTLAKDAAESTNQLLYMEVSHLEFVDPIRRFIDLFGADRLLAGSHAPLLTPATLRIKLDAARLTVDERKAITIGNAEKAGLQ